MNFRALASGIVTRAAIGCALFLSLAAPDGCGPSRVDVPDGDVTTGTTSTGTTTGTTNNTCDPQCHWDCFGGFPSCLGGEIVFNGYGARPCCGPGSGVYVPGHGACETGRAPCPTGTCGAVDPRYASHLSVAGNLSSYSFLPDAPNTADDAILLECQRAVAVAIGSPCTTNADCRPAPVGVERLRCDTESANPTCVSAPRPDAPTGYGAPCDGYFPSSSAGESASPFGVASDVCQHYADGTGCTATRTTVACSFDEDCPAGSVCLSATYALHALAGYCAPATDRTTPEGRFGPTGCP